MRIICREIFPNIGIQLVDDRPVLRNLGQSICIGPGLEALKRLVRKHKIFENAAELTIFQRQSQNGLVMAGKALED